MALGDLTVANGVVKIVGGKLTKQYEESALLHNRLQKGKGTKIGDRGIEIPTHLSGNYNHKFMTDGGEFPVGGSNLVKRASVYFKNLAGAVRLSGAAIDSIQSGDVAYIKDWLQFNLDESMGAIYKMGNIYAHGKGDGRLATISAGANSATQTVNNNDKNRFLKDGLKIDSVTPATGVVTAAGAEILNHAASSTTFTTVAAMTTTVTSDIIVASGSFNLAITGLKAIIDDTTNAAVTFQGLSRSTYPAYRAFRVDAGSTGLDVSYLRRALGAGIHINVGELNRDALEIWLHPAQTAAYSALGWNLRRFDGKSKSIDLGFTVYEYEGIGMVEDVDCDKDRIDFIDFSTMAKYIAKDFGWDNKTGSILRQVVGTSAYKDQYEAYLTARFNYGCTRPNKNAFIDGLSIPTGF
jgi:hypothetical protein